MTSDDIVNALLLPLGRCRLTVFLVTSTVILDRLGPKKALQRGPKRNPWCLSAYICNDRCRPLPIVFMSGKVNTEFVNSSAWLLTSAVKPGT